MEVKEELDRSEQRDVQRRRSPRALVVFEAIRYEGAHELGRKSWALAWSGFAAGLSMGFSFVAEVLLHAYLPDAQWTPLISKLGYSVGFLIVILARQQLFTENTLTPVLQFLHSRALSCFLQLARLWSVVLVANIFGAALFAWTLASIDVFRPEMRGDFAAVGNAAYGAGFAVDMVRAVFAGWLIALMVWLLPYAETGRVAVIIILTYLIGISGFPHVIAGSIETLYPVFIGERSFADFAVGFFLPALIGNVIGGVALVSLVHYAQVVADAESEPD